MTQRTTTIDKLVVYFNEIGQILKPHEYRLRTDTPIRFARIRSIFGSWNRMENLVRKHNTRNEKPADYVPPTDVDAILNARYAKAQVVVPNEAVETVTTAVLVEKEPKPEVWPPEPAEEPKRPTAPPLKKG
jgi:hypothetical protein